MPQAGSVSAPQTDLALAVKALQDKQAPYDRLFAYYDGEQPLTYSASRLKAAFAKLDAHFSENWCATVVDSLLDRLNLTGFQVDAAQDAVDSLWQSERLAVETDNAHEDVAITGESYVIVGKDAGGQTRIFHNDPRVCVVAYQDDNPRQKAWAAKWYVEADEAGTKRRHVTLYYPDRFEHYVSKGKAEDAKDARSFVLEDEEPNESGAIPVFHIRSRTRRTYGELRNAIEPQDAINKTLADLMVGSEYGAFPQRYVITQADVDTLELKNAPNEVWKFQAGDAEGERTQLGQFDAADLTKYLGVIDHLANSLARITRTPAHYFFQQGGNISGDALIAMEAPLAKKAAKYKERLAAAWKEAVSYALSLDGVQVAPEDVECVWEDERTVQPSAEADVVTKYVAAGVPLKTALRRAGWTPADLDALDADKRDEQASQASLAQQMLAKARAQFDQGQTSPTAAAAPSVAPGPPTGPPALQ